MDFERLDSKEFASIGIRFETEEETRAFAELIREELEVRIGEAISEGMTRKQLDEFDRCNTQEAAQRWLAANRPDYRSIVLKKREELENEIIKYRSKISGVLPVPDNDLDQIDLSGIEPWDDYLEEDLGDDVMFGIDDNDTL